MRATKGFGFIHVQRVPWVPPQGYVSGVDFLGSKTVMVLFINGRSVDCSPLKRALEATYATILPKSSKPFIYLVPTPPPARRTCPASFPHAPRM
jgi:DNA mismatch repair protein, C-terminal domain